MTRLYNKWLQLPEETKHLVVDFGCFIVLFLTIAFMWTQGT